MRFFVSLIAILGGFCSVCQRQRNKKPIKLKKKTKKVILFQTSLAALGLALIICRSKLMAPLRQYGPTMLQCCQCVAFWAGLALGPMFLSPEYTLLNALISSAFGYLVNRQYPPLTKDQNNGILSTRTTRQRTTQSVRMGNHGPTTSRTSHH